MNVKFTLIFFQEGRLARRQSRRCRSRYCLVGRLVLVVQTSAAQLRSSFRIVPSLEFHELAFRHPSRAQLFPLTICFRKNISLYFLPDFAAGVDSAAKSCFGFFSFFSRCSFHEPDGSKSTSLALLALHISAKYSSTTSSLKKRS